MLKRTAAGPLPRTTAAPLPIGPTRPIEPPGTFALPRNRYLKQFHATKAADKAARRGVKRFIRQENATELRDYLPAPGETTHAIVRGDFVIADIIPVALGDRTAELIAVATLGMSRANAEMLRGLKDTGQARRLFALVSHYFSQVDKLGTYREVRELLGDDITVARTHAKLILIDAPPDAYVFCGSANLRSSDNLEQFAVWNDRELLRWYAGIMEDIRQGSTYR